MRASPRLVIDHLVREVFLFPSAGDSLYGSLYAPSPLGAPAGLVICPAWGWESTWTDDGVHRLGLEIARRGGAALVFHWPGHGDSEGEPEDATIDRLLEATEDALIAARDRLPKVAWGLAGVRLGAAAALLASGRLEIERMLLVQPVLDPGGWLAELDRLGSRGSPGWVAGFPVSAKVRLAARETPTEEATGGFRGRGAVVRYERPTMNLPDRFVVRTLPGDWRRNIRTDHRVLFDAARKLLPGLLEVA